MNHDQLYLLKPDFQDQGKTYYCPGCAEVIGILEFYPELKRSIDIHYVDFPRPRPELISLLGEANQGCPVLVLAAPQNLPAHLKVQQLLARDDQQIGAEASLAAAQADAASAKAALDNRTVLAPEDGRVERLFYKAGEVAGAGAPVLSLSGSDAMKVLFYVNEGDRPQFALGDVLSVSCDGCASGLTATVSHFASDPQFTPPIIYSRDERSRLVFLTEAVLDQQNTVLPGQPVSIGLVP